LPLFTRQPGQNRLNQHTYIVPPCNKELAILYEDQHLLLVNKPDLLLSIPGRLKENKDCVINRLQQRWPGASIVHRLDLDTSGVMVIPLTKACHSHISRQFQERKVEKAYIAEVDGIVVNDRGEIDLPIAPDWQNRPRQKIDFDKGKSALTRYEVIQRFQQDNRTRLLIKPVTGRSHQLRIHLREIGHPILGCDLYAPEDVLARSRRLLLHATRLCFEHPATGKQIEGLCEPEF
jgi:tRNA pseudouridine32 synthase/23S rRNA pseudouridine746 synthase